MVKQKGQHSHTYTYKKKKNKYKTKRNKIKAGIKTITKNITQTQNADNTSAKTRQLRSD